MQVSQLIKQLEGMDPESEVKLALNPRWPFESGISGVKEKRGVVYIIDSNESSFLDAETDSELFDSL